MAFSVTPCPNMGPNESLYSLKWNHYQSCMTSGLVGLLNDTEYSMTDVTLACEGQFLQAHKIALAVCSPFFKQFFKMNRIEKAGVTLIALANVKFKDLKNIIHFIYNGEINVRNDELSSFLKTASFLQIQGLTESYEANQTSQTQNAKAFNFTPSNPIPSASQGGVTVTPTPAAVPIATTSQSLTRPHPVSVDQTLPVKRSRMSAIPSTSVSVSTSSVPQVEAEIPPPTTSIPLPSSSLAEYSSMHNEDEDEEEEEMISIDMKQEPIAVYSLNDDNLEDYNEGDASLGSEGIEDDTSRLEFQDFGHPYVQLNETMEPGGSSGSQDRPPANPNPAVDVHSLPKSTKRKYEIGYCKVCPGWKKRARLRCHRCQKFVCASTGCRVYYTDDNVFGTPRRQGRCHVCPSPLVAKKKVSRTRCHGCEQFVCATPTCRVNTKDINVVSTPYRKSKGLCVTCPRSKRKHSRTRCHGCSQFVCATPTCRVSFKNSFGKLVKFCRNCAETQ